MPDVSCRAFSWFTQCEALGLLDLQRVLENVGVSREVLDDPHQRVSWNDWMALTDEAVAQMSDEALEASGAAVQAALAGSLARRAPLMTDPKFLFRIGIRYVGPSIYRPVRFSLDDLPDGRLLMTVEISQDYREGLAWLRCLPPAMRKLPRFMGLPDSVVVVDTLGPRRLVVRITPPAPRSWFTRLRRGLAGIWDDSALLRELDFQQVQLSESYHALSRSEMGFRAILDALPGGVLVHRDHQVLYSNAALTSLLGGALIALDDAIPPEHRKDWLDILAGRGDPRVTPVVRTDGRQIPVLVHGLAEVRFGSVDAGVVFLLDHRAERTVHALHQATPDLVMRFEHGRLLDVHAGADHDGAAEVLGPLRGMEVHEMVKPFAASVAGPVLERGLDALWRAQTDRTHEVVPITSSFLGDKHYEARMLPLGAGDEVLLIVRDVTAMSLLQEQLTLSERMASIGSLAAGVAHEINNPLTYVTGNVAWALEELEATADPLVVEALRDALEGAHRVERIVRQMRDLSRPHPPEPSRVDVTQAVETATDLVGPELRHTARLELTLRDAPPAFIDETQLVQVLVNLLLNAAQAIPSGHRADNAISVTVDTSDHGWPRIIVCDSGPGFPAAALPRLFDPFFTTKKSSGTGLGLAISHRIVSAAGGRISANNLSAGGAVFTIELPPASSKPEQPPPPPTAETRRARIIVVDDDPPVGRAIARLLRGHDVTWSGSVADALPAIHRDKPDLILCDVMMPDQDGLDLHDALEARDRSNLVFLSGGVFSPELSVRLQSTRRPVLTKPLQPDDLRRRVREFLEPED